MRSMRVRSLTSATFDASPPSAMVLVRVTIRRFEEQQDRVDCGSFGTSSDRGSKETTGWISRRSARRRFDPPGFALQIKKSPAGGVKLNNVLVGKRDASPRVSDTSSRAGARRRWRIRFFVSADEAEEGHLGCASGRERVGDGKGDGARRAETGRGDDDAHGCVGRGGRRLRGPDRHVQRARGLRG